MEEKESGPLWEWIKEYNSHTGRMVKVGIMVGVPIDGLDGERQWNADYAICNFDLDVFDEERGKSIAYNRAVWARPKRANQPVSGQSIHVGYHEVDLAYRFTKFCKRCRRYFKDREPIAKAKKVLSTC